MGRIRTVKPEFFLHEDLYDLETETGLPIRVAFAGLWTQADREGRFEWRPRRLKAAILPYDELDFSRVLHALATRGFVQKYAVGTREFGFIPSFGRHQVINNRESSSEIPAPPEILDITDELTRAPRVDDACPTPLKHAQAEGKGREGKEEGNSPPYPPKGDGDEKNDIEDYFDAWWDEYPRYRRGSRKLALLKYRAAIKKGATHAELLAGLRRYNSAGYDTSEYAKGAESWLNGEFWTVEHFPPASDTRPNPQSNHRASTVQATAALIQKYKDQGQ